MEFTHTELHTHLMGMLSVSGLLNLLKEYDLGISINELGNVDYSNGLYYDPSQFNENMHLIENALSVSHGDSIEYSSLNTLYNNRRLILEFISEFVSKNTSIDIDEVKLEVYNRYLELSLEELEKQGITYVEISFSNPKLISSFTACNDKVKHKFLLSTDRYRSIKNFKQSSRSLEKLLDKEEATGFDIMGCELPLSMLEKEEFHTKLNVLLPIMIKYGFSTLRIHSGESKDCVNNTLDILNIINNICESLDIKLPPPRLRIGHGVYFIESPLYIELLKKLGVVVEINASSNYALGNVTDYSTIPYNYYIDNDIPVCISTDGHGIYQTTIKKDDLIAKKVVEDDRYKEILETDSELEKRGKSL